MWLYAVWLTCFLQASPASRSTPLPCPLPGIPTCIICTALLAHHDAAQQLASTRLLTPYSKWLSVSRVHAAHLFLPVCLPCGQWSSQADGEPGSPGSLVPSDHGSVVIHASPFPTPRGSQVQVRPAGCGGAGAAGWVWGRWWGWLGVGAHRCRCGRLGVGALVGLARCGSAQVQVRPAGCGGAGAAGWVWGCNDAG
eukprot:42797-Chlamydomonas_euryale.AAC.2